MVYTPTHARPPPGATGPLSMVSATPALAVPVLTMLLLLPVNDEFRIVGDEESFCTP